MITHVLRSAVCCALATIAVTTWATTPTPTATPTPASGREALADFAKRTKLRATPARGGTVHITDETLSLLDDTAPLTYVLEPGASDSVDRSVVIGQADVASPQTQPTPAPKTQETRLEPSSYPRTLEWRPTSSNDYSPYADYTVTVNQPYGANDPLGCHDLSIVSLEVGTDALTVVADRPLDPRCDFSSVLEVSSGGSVLQGSATVVLAGENNGATADSERYIYSPGS
jgi:hypothetical protein